MSSPSTLITQLYTQVRTELKTTHIPLPKKTADELEATFDEWYLAVFTLASQVNTGDEAKMVEEIRKAETAMKKYGAVLKDVGSKVRLWGKLLEKWGAEGGPSGP